MAANTVVAFATIQQLAAEKASWGQPEWSVIGLATAGATTATLAAATNALGVKIQHYLDYLTISWSITHTNASSVAIKDGSTTIWEAQIPIGSATVLHFDFSTRPLPNTAGAALSATIAGSLGANTVQEITMIGHSNAVFSPA